MEGASRNPVVKRASELIVEGKDDGKEDDEDADYKEGDE